VDDLKSSHEDLKFNDDFEWWCENMYDSDKVSHVKAVCGKVYDCLAMILDFLVPGAMIVDMKHYIDGMLEAFPYPVKHTKKAPLTEKLF
jgi:hypothetical protein